jgi:hypothetical protein
VRPAQIASARLGQDVRLSPCRKHRRRQQAPQLSLTFEQSTNDHTRIPFFHGNYGRKHWARIGRGQSGELTIEDAENTGRHGNKYERFTSALHQAANGHFEAVISEPPPVLAECDVRLVSTSTGPVDRDQQVQQDYTLSNVVASSASPRKRSTFVVGQACARCFNVDHYFAKLITTAAIGFAQFGMEDALLRILPSRKCSS